jgi:hypothetical protein
MVLDVFWWKALPLGARMVYAEELPLGPGQLRELVVEFAAEQLAAREPALGAPLRATDEGQPKRVLTMERARQIDRPIERLDRLAQPSTTSGEGISVVICSRDRCAELAVCLASIGRQRSPPAEIIVVDNSEEGSAQSICDRFSGVVHVHQPRPGLSTARNTGVRAATRDLIVFTDDDVEAHPGWLAEIARAFADSNVDAVTGLVLPASLDSRHSVAFSSRWAGSAASSCRQSSMSVFLPKPGHLVHLCGRSARGPTWPFAGLPLSVLGRSISDWALVLPVARRIPNSGIACSPSAARVCTSRARSSSITIALTGPR